MRKYVGKALTAIGLKRSAIRLYFFFTNGWAEIVGSCRKKVIPMLVHFRSSKGVYAIDLDSDWLGLGARIVKTMEILLYCQERGLTPAIRYGYAEKKKDKVDYFGDLFIYKLAAKDTLEKARYTSIKDVDE